MKAKNNQSMKAKLELTQILELADKTIKAFIITIPSVQKLNRNL